MERIWGLALNAFLKAPGLEYSSWERITERPGYIILVTGKDSANPRLLFDGAPSFSCHIRSEDRYSFHFAE
jgi:hypothetical protein